MLKSAALRHWLYGPHLSALTLYHQELNDSMGTQMYALICVSFPVVGLIMAAAGVAGTRPREAFSDDHGQLIPRQAQGR
jgi:hypothetical protein